MDSKPLELNNKIELSILEAIIIKNCHNIHRIWLEVSKEMECSRTDVEIFFYVYNSLEDYLCTELKKLIHEEKTKGEIEKELQLKKPTRIRLFKKFDLDEPYKNAQYEKEKKKLKAIVDGLTLKYYPMKNIAPLLEVEDRAGVWYQLHSHNLLDYYHKNKAVIEKFHECLLELYRMKSSV